MDDYYFETELDDRLCRSASETLDNYIRNHEMRRTREMAKSLTYERSKPWLNMSRHAESLTKDLSALDEEIALAKKLFGGESVNLSIDDVSLTTEELLMEHSFNRSFRTSSPKKADHSGHLRYSDLHNEYKEPREKSFHQVNRRSGSSPAASDVSKQNLKGLQKFLKREEKSDNQHWSTNNVHNTKYSRSRISSDDIQGELTVSMNYLPKKKLSMINSGEHHPKFHVDENVTDEEICRYQRDGEENDEGHITVSLQLEGKPASVREFMGECFPGNPSQSEDSNAGQRTVESLKNMLFSLQEAKNELENKAKSSEEDSDAPGYESLEKAMKHLVILKNLVKEVGKKDGHKNQNKR
ncbi:uncharacterized protein LOC120343353 isoform X2 [Styela clava]